jgi:hypothetical protein
MQIVNGLPPGATINIAAVLTAPSSTVEQAGGSLAGREGAAYGTNWQWSMQGTGAMSGYSRNLLLPLNTGPSFPAPPNGSYEAHAAPNGRSRPCRSSRWT